MPILNVAKESLTLKQFLECESITVNLPNSLRRRFQTLTPVSETEKWETHKIGPMVLTRYAAFVTVAPNIIRKAQPLSNPSIELAWVRGKASKVDTLVELYFWDGYDRLSINDIGSMLQVNMR